MTEAVDVGSGAPPVRLTIPTADGFPLVGYRFDAHGAELGRFVVAGATGVQQRYYRKFARFAAARGFTTLTFDYRGIGLSRQGSLRGFSATYLDWARLDVTAVVAAARSGDTPVRLVGHSFGGQTLGLLHNHAGLSGAYIFGTGAGWAGWMPKLEAWKVRLMWSAVLPVLVATKGYMAWSKFGMGEDLPLGVYRQWKRWCKYPRYFFDDPELQHLTAAFAEVRMPIVAVNSVDDLWAPPKSRDAFIEQYANCDIRRVDLSPQRETAGIGHMGYFNAEASWMWEDVLSWARPVASTATSPDQRECSIACQ